MSRLLCLLLFAAVALPALGADEVAPREKLRFDQDKATAHMRELEERMFRLGEMLREGQPDDSARLLMAFRTAREQLIVDQMKQIDDMLAKVDLNQADERQQEVITKLKELRELLLSRNLDLAFRLDQLRKLREGAESLNRLIEKEKQQLDQSGELAKENKTDPKAAEPLRDNEERNRRAAEDLQRALAQSGQPGQPAADKVGKAGGSMGKASDKLGQGQPGEAGADQVQAIDQLTQAQQDLEEAEKKLLEQMEPLVRTRVIENLTAMLTEQRKIRETTEGLSGRVAEGQRPAVLAVQRLAGGEQQVIELADQTIQLVEETRFSVALPPALGAVRDRMAEVGTELGHGYAHAEVIESQKTIEADLEALLDAMKARAKYAKAGKAGQCNSCGSQPNKLLAEVKMLRWMQGSVNKETTQVDKLIQASPQAPQGLLDRTKKLRDREDQIRKATQGLHERTCPDCVGGHFQ